MPKRFADLVDLMAKLRSPEGCPWDREQNRETLKPYLVEETHEVIEAMDSGEPSKLKEELGDLLFQILFHAQLSNEAGEFDVYDVVVASYDKMRRRHPHVFGDIEVADSGEVLANWERIKRGEKGLKDRKSILSGVPPTLPALLQASRLQEKAGTVGFDWKRNEDVLDKIREELMELEFAFEEGKRAEMEHELGDLIFAAVNLARKLRISAENALVKANKRFFKRFNYIEREAEKRGVLLESMTLEEMDVLWEQAKELFKRSEEAD